MDKDRKEIALIISRMLDSGDEYGIYPTSDAFDELEEYIQGERMQAIGWAHADSCITLDDGGDPRSMAVPDMLERAKKDLGPTQQ